MNALPDNACAQASQDLVMSLCAYYNADRSDARFLTSNNLAFPRAPLIATGGFDAEYQKAAAEDRELCHRWRRNGGRILVVPGAVVRHSHRLTLGSFWRQHFTYGIGARHFRAALAARGAGRVRIEPLGFYWSLVAWPVRARGIRGIREGLLVALAQAANAAGFLYEAARQRRTPAVSVPKTSR
jgi:GT2 family glycosyltransferase